MKNIQWICLAVLVMIYTMQPVVAGGISGKVTAHGAKNGGDAVVVAK